MKKFWSIYFIFWPLAALYVCWMAPGWDFWFPPNPAEPGSTASASPLGDRIDDLFYMILWIVTATFILTHIGLGYVLWVGATREEGKKGWFTHGSHSLEIMWTIVPSVILLFIAFVQLDVWAEFRVMNSFPEGADKHEAAIAEVTARQFEWRIRYPAPGKELQDTPQPDDLYMVNELHVPSGKNVRIILQTQDVQHAFFLPELRVKQDAVPGLRIPVWFNAEKSATYTMLCAELCGWGHYKMKANLVAESDEAFEEYKLQLQAEQNDDGVPDESEEEDE